MSENPDAGGSARVAVLVDCDNTTPDALGHALRAVARFGRIVVRRGYGNHGTLTAKWRESLVDHAFTPHLQFQYAAGKNTADIAMALDALELLWDDRADTFCLVTSDSDFAYLCRKLRERGASVCIVGEAKTPDALRNASDQFFELELLKAEMGGEPRSAERGGRGNVDTAFGAIGAAVATLAADSSDGWVSLSSVSGYIKRTDPGFDPKRFGFTRFKDLVKAHRRLDARQDAGQWWLRQKEEPLGQDGRPHRRYDDPRTPDQDTPPEQSRRDRMPESRPTAERAPVEAAAASEAQPVAERSGRGRRQRGGKRSAEVQFVVAPMPVEAPADVAVEAPPATVSAPAAAVIAEASPPVAAEAPVAPIAAAPSGTDFADDDKPSGPPRSGARTQARRGGRGGKAGAVTATTATPPAAGGETAAAVDAVEATAKPARPSRRGSGAKSAKPADAAEGAGKPARSRRKPKASEA